MGKKHLALRLAGVVPEVRGTGSLESVGRRKGHLFTKLIGKIKGSSLGLNSPRAITK